MKKMFENIKISWPAVILFAVIAGVYTGTVMMIDALKDTSFQDIGINYEWWVIFAVIITANCKKSYEAMLKCFVFFLISQPLIFAVQILAGRLSLDMGMYYYRSIWLPVTFLTLLGGFIAYHCKKQNLIGAVILGLGNTIQSVLGVFYFAQAIKSFPHHLLSVMVCFGSIFWMSFQIQKAGKYRSVSVLIPFVLTILLLGFAKMTGRTII